MIISGWVGAGESHLWKGANSEGELKIWNVALGRMGVSGVPSVVRVGLAWQAMCNRRRPSSRAGLLWGETKGTMFSCKIVRWSQGSTVNEGLRGGLVPVMQFIFSVTRLKANHLVGCKASSSSAPMLLFHLLACLLFLSCNCSYLACFQLRSWYVGVKLLPPAALVSMQTLFLQDFCTFLRSSKFSPFLNLFSIAECH
jgi:hypothetical protein